MRLAYWPTNGGKTIIISADNQGAIYRVLSGLTNGAMKQKNLLINLEA